MSDISPVDIIEKRMLESMEKRVKFNKSINYNHIRIKGDDMVIFNIEENFKVVEEWKKDEFPAWILMEEDEVNLLEKCFLMSV